MTEFRKKIDSDWKAKAAREKAQLAKKQELKKAEAEAGGDDDAPKVQFEDLLRSLAMQAQLALGLVPDPMGRGRRPDPESARHAIGMLEMLQTKTQGNLTDKEEATLTSLVTELKMIYVRMTGRG